jgi:serine/threonine protein kinase
MDRLVRKLFNELAGRSPSDRRKIFEDRGIAPEVRKEVEALLAFDSTADHRVTAGISEAAEDLLECSEPPGSGNWGPYRRLRLLGNGGMGSVYLAERTDGEVEQKVAVKVLRADVERSAWRERFLKERQLLANMSHPFIARLIDAGHTGDGRPYFVMEYIDGIPIDTYAANLDTRDQLSLFLRVCEAVSYAHRHLVIHRDIKPSNVLVDGAGQPKLLDFGIAKLLHESDDQTNTIDQLLTPNYASPEQLRGAADTTATDVYSLGAVLYKVVTGRSPRDAAGDTAFPPAASTFKSGLPTDLDYILRKALRPESSERYVSVEALSADIQALLDWRPVQARSGDRWYRSRRFVRRHRIPLGFGIILMLVLSIGMYEINRQRGIAQRRFQQVRQLSNKVLALDESMRNLSGTTKVRQTIVAMSKEYLEGLESEVHGDPEMSLELGSAYLSLAFVQGIPGNPNLGMYDEARKSLIKAESFLQTVPRSSKWGRTALEQLAKISEDRMILADTDHSDDQVRTFAAEAISRTETILSLGPTLQENARAANVLNNVALAYKNLHLYDECVRTARRSIEVSATLPNKEIHRSNGQSLIADALRLSGDLDGALQSIREAHQSLPPFRSGEMPQDIIRRFNVLWREGVILGGDGQFSLERKQEAVASLQEAFELIQEWARRDSDDAAPRILFEQTARELGGILRHDHPEQALAIYEAALLRLREIKNNAKARRSEASVMALSAYVLRPTNPHEAQRRIDGAFELLRSTKDYPSDRIVLGNEPETVLRAWADHLADIGEPQRAAETYQELLDKVIASHPDPKSDLRYATGMSRIYEALERLHRRNGHAELAGVMASTRLQIWQEWNRKLPQNTFIQKQLLR